MAAVSNFNDEIEKLFECNICLERMKNPKVLACTHSFCKSCLDSILEFEADGSAIINCPLRCDEFTTINTDQTTNDLKAPMQFKNIIALLDARNDGSDVTESCTTCQEHPKCQRIVSASCSVCFVKLCTSCQTKHQHEGKQHYGDGEFVPVKFRRDTKELLPWCKEHSTFATYACQEGFICIYCKARAHSEHYHYTIETLSQEIVDWVQNQKPLLPDVEFMLTSSKQKTEEEAKRVRESLEREIKNRKYISIQRLLKRLIDEEERLLREFDSTISKHLSSYPSSKPTDYIKDKPQFELLANKEYIFQNVINITSAVVTVPRISFTFSDDDDSMCEMHPLGVLEQTTDTVTISDGLVTVSSSIMEHAPTNDVILTLLDDLRQIQDELDYIDIDETKGMKVNERDIKDFGVNNLVKVLRSYDSKESDKSKMAYLCDLMKQSDYSNFQLLWYAIPDELLKLKCNDCCMLHLAATFNKSEFVKIILIAGVNVNENEDGGTALFIATGNRNLPIVQLLVEYNADILIQVDGYNVIDVAKKGNFPEIVDFLLNELKRRDVEDTGVFNTMSIENIKEENLVDTFVRLNVGDILDDDSDSE